MSRLSSLLLAVGMSLLRDPVYKGVRTLTLAQYLVLAGELPGYWSKVQQCCGVSCSLFLSLFYIAVP